MTTERHLARSSSLLSLSSAPIRQLLDAMETDAADLSEFRVPPRSFQIANLIVAEAVRLIRLGTSTEMAEAADLLSHFLMRERAGAREKEEVATVRLLTAASVVLAAAMSPSSRGSELSVLRSWNGNALKAMLILSGAVDQALPRRELKDRLGISDESYVSHMLADLESAGLVSRTRQGREVLVRLGKKALEAHVAAAIDSERSAEQSEIAEAVVERVRNLLKSADGFDRNEATRLGHRELFSFIEKCRHALVADLAGARELGEGSTSIELEFDLAQIPTDGSSMTHRCRLLVTGRQSDGTLLDEQVWVAADQIDRWAPMADKPTEVQSEAGTQLGIQEAGYRETFSFAIDGPSEFASMVIDSREKFAPEPANDYFWESSNPKLPNALGTRAGSGEIRLRSEGYASPDLDYLRKVVFLQKTQELVRESE